MMSPVTSATKPAGVFFKILITPLDATLSVVEPLFENPALKVTVGFPTRLNTGGETDAITCALADPVDVPPAEKCVELRDIAP